MLLITPWVVPRAGGLSCGGSDPVSFLCRRPEIVTVCGGPASGEKQDPSRSPCSEPFHSPPIVLNGRQRQPRAPVANMGLSQGGLFESGSGSVVRRICCCTSLPSPMLPRLRAQPRPPPGVCDRVPRPLQA